MIGFQIAESVATNKLLPKQRVHDLKRLNKDILVQIHLQSV